MKGQRTEVICQQTWTKTENQPAIIVGQEVRANQMYPVDVAYVGTVGTVIMMKIDIYCLLKIMYFPIEFVWMNLSVIHNTHVHELAYQLDNFK